MDESSYKAGAMDMLSTLLRGGRVRGFRIVTCWPADERIEEAKTLLKYVPVAKDIELDVDDFAAILSEYSHYVDKPEIFQ